MLEKRVYFIARLYINCKGETSVTYDACEDGAYGLHQASDYNDPNIIYYDTEAEALRAARAWANTETSVHCRYIAA